MFAAGRYFLRYLVTALIFFPFFMRQIWAGKQDWCLVFVFQEIYKDRKKFSKQVFEVASSDLVNMGITVVSYTLKDIRDDEVRITPSFQRYVTIRNSNMQDHNSVSPQHFYYPKPVGWFLLPTKKYHAIA